MKHIIVGILVSAFIVACGHGNGNNGTPMPNLKITLNESTINIGSQGTGTVTVTGSNITYPLTVEFTSESPEILTASSSCIISDAESTGCNTIFTGVESGITTIIATANGVNPATSESITVNKLKLAYISVYNTMASMGSLLTCQIMDDGELNCDTPIETFGDKSITYGMTFNNAGNIGYIANDGGILDCAVGKNGWLNFNNSCALNSVPSVTPDSGLALSNVHEMLYITTAKNKVMQCPINVDGTIKTLDCQASTNILNGYAGIAVSESLGFAYMVNNSNNEISVCSITGSGELDNCADNSGNDLLKAPYAIALNNNSDKIYITNTDVTSHGVVTCDVQANNGQIENCNEVSGDIFKTPKGIAISANNKFAYITNFDGRFEGSSGGVKDGVLKCPLNGGIIDKDNCTNAIKELRGATGFTHPKAITLVD